MPDNSVVKRSCLLLLLHVSLRPTTFFLLLLLLLFPSSPRSNSRNGDFFLGDRD